MAPPVDKEANLNQAYCQLCAAAIGQTMQG